MGSIKVSMGCVRQPQNCWTRAESRTPKIDALFEAAGLPGPPPPGPHPEKEKVWLFRDLNKPEVDGLSALGAIIQEAMDAELDPDTDQPEWNERYETKRDKVHKMLSACGLAYFEGGTVVPSGQTPDYSANQTATTGPQKPTNLDELLELLIKELPRAMHPLTHCRASAENLSFDSEWDIQDLLHSHLVPWVQDISREENGPSHAGSTARMDFLLIEHSLVLEAKRVRDRPHGRKVGEELTIDIDHYRKHPDGKRM